MTGGVIKYLVGWLPLLQAISVPSRHKTMESYLKAWAGQTMLNRAFLFNAAHNASQHALHYVDLSRFQQTN